MKKKRQQPASLHPLTPEEALRGLMQVKPKGKREMAQKKLRCPTCYWDFIYEGSKIVPEHDRTLPPRRCVGSGREGDVVEED